MGEPSSAKSTISDGEYSSAYSYGYRKRHGKTDWAGVGLGDAFKPNLDYFVRMPAQRLFYRACRKIQILAAQLTGKSLEAGGEAKIKPQLSPCYTSYPSTLAAYAAIGLTGFLEYESRLDQNVLLLHMQVYMKEFPNDEGRLLNPDVFKKVVEITTKSVQTRLLLEDISRTAASSPVEIYRLFSASQQNMRFSTLAEIINVVILYGDVLPDWRIQALHPLTRDLLCDVGKACDPFFGQLSTSKSSQTPQMGVAWAEAVCDCLLKYLPSLEDTPPEALATNTNDRTADAYRFLDQTPQPSCTDEFTPLDGAHPPTLFESSGAAERAMDALIKKGEASKDLDGGAVRKEIQDFSSAIEKAAGQGSQWQDMRSDLIERALRTQGFCQGPIQGSPTDGHEVKLRLGEGRTAGGEIYDRPVELSEDCLAHEELLADSQLITQALVCALYPNIEELLEIERLRTTGTLDPARLAVTNCSSVVFKRNRILEQADRRGQPVLLIACDGSGSLDRNQMRMLKILAAAWLGSTIKSHIQIVAGLYHSGIIRQGLSGPLVQWIYHPQKTPSISRKEAVRALVALPDSGTGVQSDALSLAFMLEEARRLARGRMIYLILISDCAWNRSFGREQSGKDEVYSLFQVLKSELADRLHVTLVAVGVQGETGFEKLLDKVVTVPKEKLCDHAAVAEEVGVYVASCMKERRKLISVR